MRARYDDLLQFFELQWRSHDHQSVHFGYYDDQHSDAGSTMTNMTRTFAAFLDVDGSDLVVDLGCGAGGDAVWLAANRGARVLGVDLVSAQLSRAHEHAATAGVDDRVAFRQADFHELDVTEAGAIDVAWALESLSHSPDPATAVAAVHDVLAAGGRFGVSDVFLRDGDHSAAVGETLESIEASMGLEFQRIGEFETTLRSAGFDDLERREITPAIMPGAERSLGASSLLGPLANVGSSIGIGTDAVGAYMDFWSDVYELLEADVAGYYFVRAETGANGGV